MAVAYAIPRPSEPVLDQNGHFTVPWQNYLRTRYGDAAAEEIIAELEAQIADLLARVEALEDGESARIVGPQSVSVVGSLENGLVQLTLVNDESEPLPVSFYATDENQDKGWQLLQPNWVPNPYADYLVDENGNYLVDENGNFLTGQDGFPLPAEYVGVNNSTFEVLTATDAQTAFNQIDAALLDARATGVRYGGEITGFGTANASVASGAGAILDNSDPENPIYTAVMWSTLASFAVPSGQSWFYVDDTGTVNNTTTEPSHAEYRQYIQLGRVSVTGGVITGIQSNLVPIQQTPAQVWDVWKALGLVKSGLQLFASGANLKLSISSGEIYSPGVSFHISAENPSEAEFSAFDTAGSDVFRMATSTGVITTDATDIPVGFYDVAGTVTAIPGASNRTTIFTVYRFPSGNVRILYGDAFYNSIDDAFNALGTYSPSAPAGFSDAIILGYILPHKGATDLSDPAQARFVQTNKFGGVGGAIATAAVINHNDTSNIQGGTTGEYYHLTADEYDQLNAPLQLLTGQEYLYAFHTKLMAGTTASMIFSGDSTTEGGGTGATGAYIISTAMLSQGQQKGHKLTSTNAGHSGASTLDWITTYLATDLAAVPDLYVVRWGLNDPFYGMDITDFETNLDSGLSTIRASYGVDDMSVVVMVPNTANDTPNGRDAAWLKQVRVVARRLAKQYQCAFMDTYSLWTDSEHAAGLWMDDPFGDGRAIHPKNVFNSWIVTKMAELIFPAFLDAAKWGTYTPTLTNGANVASSTPSQCQWSRTGNVITVSGRVDIACTAAANTLTVVGMSLPVASNLTLSGNLAGGGAIGQTTYQTFICLGDTTNDRATLQFLSNGTTSAAAFFSFTYLVQ